MNDMESDLTIEMFLDQIGRFRQSRFGRQFRNQFRDTRGTSELAMLKAPTEDEFRQLCKIAEVMADSEKVKPELLDDNDIEDIASRAQCDRGIAAILINGFVLAQKNSQV